MKLGDSASLTKEVLWADVQQMALVTGDNNPLHTDEEFARKSMFKRRIAHGLIAAGLISAVLGTKLPGPGTIYLSQTLQFLAPVFPDDIITATVTVIDMDTKRRTATLKTEVKTQAGTDVLSGLAKVIYMDGVEHGA